MPTTCCFKNSRAALSFTSSKPATSLRFTNPIASASSLKETKCNLEIAKKLGAAAAEAAKAKGITKVVVDRGGFKFTGRVAAIVASAVENGLSISDKPAKEAE